MERKVHPLVVVVGREDLGSLDQARTLQLRPSARVCRGRGAGLALGLTALLAASMHARDLDPQVVAKWPRSSRGSALALAVAGDYAYVAAGSLQVIDVRDPANPQRVRGYPTLHGVRDVAVMGRYASMVDDTPGLWVIDLDNPLVLHGWELMERCACRSAASAGREHECSAAQTSRIGRIGRV